MRAGEKGGNLNQARGREAWQREVRFPFVKKE